MISDETIREVREHHEHSIAEETLKEIFSNEGCIDDSSGMYYAIAHVLKTLGNGKHYNAELGYGDFGEVDFVRGGRRPTFIIEIELLDGNTQDEDGGNTSYFNLNMLVKTTWIKRNETIKKEIIRTYRNDYYNNFELTDVENIYS